MEFYEYYTDAFEGYTVTDAAGYYSYQHLSSGKYKVKAVAFMGYSDEFYNGWFYIQDGDSVSVTRPGTTSFIDFYLEDAAEIHGTVYDSSWLPIEGVFVAA